MTRPNEGPRTKDQIILFSKMTVNAGQRKEFSKHLLDGMEKIKTDEPGTLSIVLIEDEANPDVLYVMERFKDQAAVEEHMNASAKVRDLFAGYIKQREGGFMREVTGFVSKDD